MTGIPTAEELDALFRDGKMERLGDGSRRVCYALPGGKLCIKSYRGEDELETRMKPDGSLEKHTLKPSVIREIRKARFDEKRNTSCQEYRYWKKLREKIPPEIFDVFPQTMECVFVPSRGWCVIEERVENYDCTNLERFSHVYRSATEEVKAELLSSLGELVSSFMAYAVRLYDPQNIVVQMTSENGFRLRLVDFEPSARCLIPVDSMIPAFVRMKNRRRVIRWMRDHLGVDGRNVIAGKHRLPPELRAKWDMLIATEGVAMGLSDCRVFLENKLVNDIFYEGRFNGRPCIVKCSSRSPDSICNEYKMLVRVYTADSEVFPKPYGCWISRDGRFAFIIMEKVAKGDRISCEKYAEGLKSILFALRNTGVVHRDIIKDNIITDKNGMPKLIDFQFAIDRNSYSESNYMRKHMIYRLVLFGAGVDKKPGQWNDAVQVAWILRFNERNPKVDKIIEEIRSEFSTSNFECKMSWLEKITVYGYDYILRICLLFAGGKKKKSLLARLNRI